MMGQFFWQPMKGSSSNTVIARLFAFPIYEIVKHERDVMNALRIGHAPSGSSGRTDKARRTFMPRRSP